jgi:hypothetical protein
MLNPESVILNLFQNLFRAALLNASSSNYIFETLNQVQRDKQALYPSKNQGCAISAEGKGVGKHRLYLHFT